MYDVYSLSLSSFPFVLVEPPTALFELSSEKGVRGVPRLPGVLWPSVPAVLRHPPINNQNAVRNNTDVTYKQHKH